MKLQNSPLRQSSFLAICLATVSSLSSAARAEGPLPEFSFKSVVLDPRQLTFAPTGQFERACLLKMEGRIPNPLGKYYLYFSPHKPAGIGLAYSDSIDGPWTEYSGNPVIEHAAIPEVHWIPETGKFHLWAYSKRSQTDLWTSPDGLHFEHHSTSIAGKNIGTRNATYTRVYEYPLERYGNKYIMLYSGFDLEREIRCVWLAHSKDGESWTQETTPLVEPIENENKDIYGPSLVIWQGRNFIVYQDHTGYRGGNVKYVEMDQQLNPVGDQGERLVLIKPVTDSPIENRYRECEFYRDGDTMYMFASGGDDPRRIVYATAKIGDAVATEEPAPEQTDKPQTDRDQPEQNQESSRHKAGSQRDRPSANEKLQLEPTTSTSLDQILKDYELETIYETSFDEPIRMIRESELLEDGKIAGELPEDVDWVLEGAAEATVSEGRLHLKNESDHCVLWNTREFPESFVAEWDFQHHAPQGTAIIFFAAQAKEGGSIFSPGLPKRAGRFGNYTRGEINCYHTSYSATDEEGVPRGATHLKKDGQEVDKAKLANGLALIDGKMGRPFRIRLAKLQNRIILEIDGEISFDVFDGGEETGASYHHGQIGFRQMRHTIEASYGGFKVQSVTAKTGT